MYLELDSDNKRSGTYCIKCTAGVANDNFNKDITTVAGQWYTFQGYIKAVSGDSVKIAIESSNGTYSYKDSGWITATSYTQVVSTFKAETTTTRVKIICQNNGDIAYVDDFSLVPLIKVAASTETPTPLTDSYAIGKWNTNTVGSIYVDGADVYTIPVSSTDLTTTQGSLALWYRPDWDYDAFNDNPVLLDLANFARIYYDKDDYKFKGAIYDGSALIISGSESEAQSFTSGTWVHLTMTYNNTVGTNLYVNGTSVGSFSGDWSAQTLPSLMSIGCVSGTGYGRANGHIDDVHLYATAITPTNIETLYGENHSSD